jgi:cellulose synthase/poly-beta-1,6-N-acetylglucosamine synthase-like glycosyltransferase
MFDALSITFLSVVSVYFILISSFFAGWLRTRKFQAKSGSPSVSISILVPCHNERNNITELTEALDKQDYPKELVEVIWIDDHSVDGTGELLDQILVSRTNHRVLHLSGPESGKKAGLKAGMECAAGELILLTDADSRPGKDWIRTMAGFYQETNTDLIAGPVVLGPVTTWQEKIQKLEFLSLVASSVGSAGIGKPVMLQGPNIGVSASDYQAMVHDLDNRFISGDDVFLLQAMKRIPGRKIRYVMSREAIITSKPAASLGAFLRQRQRWASKAKGYTDPFLVLTTLVVFLTNLSILVSLVTALGGWSVWHLPLVLLGIKSAADLPLLIRAARFFNCTSLLIWFLPLQIAYPFYITLTGFWSFWGRVRWR